jgi:hypothetical protein
VFIQAGSSDAEWHTSGNFDLGTDEPGTIFLQGATVLGVGPEAKLTVDAKLTVGPQGDISGNGTITAGQLINNGTIQSSLSIHGLPRPQHLEAMSVSPGMIQINGNYQQTATGALRIELAGLEAG